MRERVEIVCLLKSMLGRQNPLGSGTACEMLAKAGFQISEATVGRLLKTMDNKGYTTRIGFQGRMLTDQGREG